MGVDAPAATRVDSAPVEQVARHVLQPEAVRQMVQNAILNPCTAAPISVGVQGRSVPTAG